MHTSSPADRLQFRPFLARHRHLPENFFILLDHRTHNTSLWCKNTTTFSNYPNFHQLPRHKRTWQIVVDSNKQEGKQLCGIIPRTATAVQDFVRKETDWSTNASFFWFSPMNAQLKRHLQALIQKEAQQVFEHACLQTCSRSFVRKSRGRRNCGCYQHSFTHCLSSFLLMLKNYMH